MNKIPVGPKKLGLQPGIFSTNCLHQFFYTKIFVFLHHKFYFFTLKILLFFTKFLSHQYICFSYTKIFVFLHQLFFTSNVLSIFTLFGRLPAKVELGFGFGCWRTTEANSGWLGFYFLGNNFDEIFPTFFTPIFYTKNFAFSGMTFVNYPFYYDSIFF